MFNARYSQDISFRANDDASDLYFLCYYIDFIVHGDFLYNQRVKYI